VVGQQNADIADMRQLRDVAMATIFAFLYMGLIGATWRIRLNRPCAAAMQPTLTTCLYLPHPAGSELRKVLFLAMSVTFLFAYEIPQEPLNGSASNSQGRRVWSLARRSLKSQGER